MKNSSRYLCTPFTAAWIVLRNFSYLTKWREIEAIFGMHASELSEFCWKFEILETLWGHLLETFRSVLISQSSSIYARSIGYKGAPLHNFIGCIDCIKIQMSRPGSFVANQRTCYLGHNWLHCLIYQKITTEDGLMFHFYRLEVIIRHDMTLHLGSGLNDALQEGLLIVGNQYFLYGDLAYLVLHWLKTPFSHIGATPAQNIYNSRRIFVHEAV